MGVLSRLFGRNKMIPGYQYIERQSPIAEPNFVGMRLTVPQVIRDLEWGTRLDCIDDVIAIDPGRLTRPMVEEALRYYHEHKSEVDKYISESIKRSGNILRSNE